MDVSATSGRLIRKLAVIGLSTVAVVATLSTAGSASPVTYGSDQGTVDAAVHAYRTTYPQMSVAAARTAFEQ